MCAKCGRWNLTPLEERWEAIEECERQFRATLKRTSTDQIGLGRVSEGTDLIRIGEPLRPEFASWRYGRHFQRRRRRAQIVAAAGFAGTIAGALAGVPLIAGSPAIISFVIRLAMRETELARAQKFIKTRAQEGFKRRIWKHERIALRIIPTDDMQGWGLRFALDGKFLDFAGADALHTAHLIAPAFNAGGGPVADVNLAVREIEIAKSPELYFSKVLKFGQAKGWHYTGITEYPSHMRLAFEMATHEETERAAVEGDLVQLETDWREAEEIAAISDNLFLPRAVTEFIERNRGS